jgi:hypothetical protein
MIIDIDNQESIQIATELITKDWFNPDEIYGRLKATGETGLSGFWNIHTDMIAAMSTALECTSDEFLNEWDQRCIGNDTRFMGYHCTRHSDKQVFLEKGILPLSGETIRIANDNSQSARETSVREYRFEQAPGPFFLLSYKCAKKPDNHFCLNGPEILLGCAGQHIDVDAAKSVPLIIHCAIPYSFLFERDYFAFCVFRAYFIFLDPEDDTLELFDGYSIDLRGKALDPEYIVRIEETEPLYNDGVQPIAPK